jgi:hypothetical protein
MDMKAKQIFERDRGVTEAESEAGGQMLRGENPPPGATGAGGRPPRPMDPEAMLRMRMRHGGPRPPGMGEPMQGPFTHSEMSKLKDVFLLILAKMAGSEYDEAIVRKMMTGEALEPGQVQHILDEAGRAGDLPEQYHKLLQKIHDTLQRGGG